MSKVEIGSKTVKSLKLKVCLGCNGVIAETGLCTYGCAYDGDLCRVPGTAVYRVYERVDTLLSEQPV